MSRLTRGGGDIREGGQDELGETTERQTEEEEGSTLLQTNSDGCVAERRPGLRPASPLPAGLGDEDESDSAFFSSPFLKLFWLDLNGLQTTHVRMNVSARRSGVG